VRRFTTFRATGRALVCVAVAAMGLAMSPAGAGAATGSLGKVTVYSSISAGSIAPGADGNIWVSDGSSIEKVSTSGQVLATYPVSGAADLSSGLYGRIWFGAGSGQIGRISSTGHVTMFTVPSDCGSPMPGPYRQIWMRCGDSAGRLKIATGDVDTFALPHGTQTHLVLGPDGNMWFGDLNGTVYQVGRIKPSGTGIKLFNLGSPPSYECTIGFDDITSGPGSRLWFDGFDDFQHCRGASVLSMSTTGVGGPGTGGNAQDFSGITEGPDRHVWVGDQSPYDSIWRISPDGAVQQFHIPNSGHSTDPVPGPDGRVWFIDDGHLAAIGTSVS
jgi:streptogramin lyase